MSRSTTPLWQFGDSYRAHKGKSLFNAERAVTGKKVAEFPVRTRNGK